MNKKKVMCHIDDAIAFLNNLRNYVNGYNSNSHLTNALKALGMAQDELKKSDWISVEDELPEYNEKVLVCNKRNSKDFWIDYRSEFQLLGHNFKSDEIYSGGPVTHWRKIDKLEE